MEKQRGFPDSGKGAQDEPSQAEDTASGELLREGDSLEGNQKEQGSYDCPVREPSGQQ